MVTAEVATESREPAELHIICVDDDGEFLKSLEFFLPEQINRVTDDDFWYRFLFFHSAADALAAIQELIDGHETIAMVISDQKMPEMKGTDFLAEVKRLTADSVRVLLTGHAGMDAAIAAINERLLDKYLTKPIENEHDFTTSIVHLLQRFRMERTISEQNRTLGALFEFANTLNAHACLGDTVRTIAAFSRELLDASRSAVLLLDEGVLSVHAAEGISGWNSTDGARPLDAAMASALLGDGAFYADHRYVQQFRSLLSESKASSAPGRCLIAGLGSVEQPMGLLVLGQDRPDRTFGSKELQELAFVANSASVALHNQLNRIELERLWVEARDQAEALASANGRLEILDHLKTDFLTFISHELRTPLVQLSALNMIDVMSSPLEREQLMQVVRHGYERLDGFVRRTLDYFGWLAESRVDPSELVDLREFARAFTDSMPELQTSAIQFVPPEAGPACPVLIDRDAMSEVLRIFLDNALKFTSDGRAVRLRVSLQNERVLLMVEDEGNGFEPEWGRELFRPFTVANINHHHAGAALSLAKALAIAEAHGARIGAESQGPGQGARFWVELPLAPEIGASVDSSDTLSPDAANRAAA